MKGQVPAVGPLTSPILVAHLPEFGQRDGKALTTLVGLAPWSRDSGQQRGNRAIRGGGVSAAGTVPLRVVSDTPLGYLECGGVVALVCGFGDRLPPEVDEIDQFVEARHFVLLVAAVGVGDVEWLTPVHRTGSVP